MKDPSVKASVLTTLGRGGGFTIPELVSGTAATYPRIQETLEFLQDRGLVEIKQPAERTIYYLKSDRPTAEIFRDLQDADDAPAEVPGAAANKSGPCS